MKKVILLLIFTFHSYGEVEFLDFAIPELVTSPGSLGMGNANFGSDLDGYTAFTNPAAIRPISKYRFGFINLSGEFSSDTFSNTFGKEGLSFDSIQKGVDFLSNRNMRDALFDAGSGYLYQRLGVLSYFQFKKIVIGHFSSHQSNGALVDKSSNFYGNRREDHGPYIAYTTKFSRKFSFGSTYSYIKRSETHAVVNPGANDIYNETSQGFLNHLITSIKYDYDRQFSVSLVNRNSLGAIFVAKNNGSPTKIPNTTDLAFSSILKRKKIHFNLVLRDLTNSYENYSSSKKLQLGGAYFFARRPASMRFGYLDGQVTLGFDYKTKHYGKYGFSTYAVDSSITGVVDVDRRFVLEFSI